MCFEIILLIIIQCWKCFEYKGLFHRSDFWIKLWISRGSNSCKSEFQIAFFTIDKVFAEFKKIRSPKNSFLQDSAGYYLYVISENNKKSSFKHLIILFEILCKWKFLPLIDILKLKFLEIYKHIFVKYIRK